MIFNNYEKNDFKNLYRELKYYANEILISSCEGDIFWGIVDTWYESNNNLEEGESLFEEYNVCLIRIISIIERVKLRKCSKFYEISYKNIPFSIKTVDDIVLFERNQ